MRSVRAARPCFSPGHANFHSAMKSTMKEIVPQMSSFFAGKIGLGAFWQSSTSLLIVEQLDAVFVRRSANSLCVSVGSS